MNTYKIHAAAKGSAARSPYLLLSSDGMGRARIDLTGLDTDFADAPVFTISLDALYQVLEGKPLVSSLPAPEFLLLSDGDELILEYHARPDQQPLQVRLWLAEFALAWNMLTGFGKPRSAFIAA